MKFCNDSIYYYKSCYKNLKLLETTTFLKKAVTLKRGLSSNILLKVKNGLLKKYRSYIKKKNATIAPKDFKSIQSEYDATVFNNNH